MQGLIHAGRRFAVRTSAVVSAAVLLTIAPPSVAQSQNWVAERGVLPRGTTYEMRKPNNWNGVLIDDLDFAATPPVGSEGSAEPNPPPGRLGIPDWKLPPGRLGRPDRKLPPAIDGRLEENLPQELLSPPASLRSHPE